MSMHEASAWKFVLLSNKGISGTIKSRLLMCLIGKTQLLSMQCRGIGPHLVARGKSHGFSQVAAGTWGIFSSCDGDAHSKREFVY